MDPTPLAALGVTLPVLAAPMAGGPTTPELVGAAARVGSLGFLAGGYRSVDELAGQMAAVRAMGVPFGVNLFAPNPLPVDAAAYRGYARAMAAEARRYGVELPAGLIEDDDLWAEKVDLLQRDPVPVVSFTFGIAPAEIVAGLRRAGTVVVQTVTSATEALLAEGAADLLAVQSAQAGGHFGTMTPRRPTPPLPLTDLVSSVRAVVPRPVIAAGGLGTAADVHRVLAVGAAAAMVGTALLRTDEAGTSATHRAALAERTRDTIVTRSFTGRPARGLRNEFIDDHDADAPLGYPALHHLTSPLRRAAAAAGDPERVHLWAGTGYRHATEESAAVALSRLAWTG